MENIIENNKLIAEFMGAKVELIGDEYYFYDWKNKLCSITPIKWNETPKKTLNKIWENALNPEFGRLGLFNSDWNWLMKVVEKIESLENNIKNETREEFTQFQKVLSLTIYSKIEAVYSAVVEFIKWYNKNNNPCKTKQDKRSI